MKNKLFLLILLISVIYKGQDFSSKKTVMEEDEDIEYEVKHKSMSWFSEMKDYADYFKIKSNFDKYFGNHRWEKSKPRSLGEDWLRTKLFYLNEKGKVVPEPFLINDSKTKNGLLINTQTQVGTWSMIGPVNSANTSYSVQGNHGGYVYLNKIDPTNPQKIFVSFVTGGLWRTIDGGSTWNLVDNGFPDSKYNDIDVCIANPQIVYALSDNQLIKSTDGGLNWLTTTMTANNYPGKAYDIAVSPANPDIVVVRWGTSLYRTIDGGSSWNEVYTGLPNYAIWDSSIHSECLEWDTNNSNSVYFASTSNNNVFKVYKSVDQGASFSQLNSTTLNASSNGQIIGWTKVFLPSNNATSFYIAVGTGSSAYGHNAVHLYKLNKLAGNVELTRTNMISGIGDPVNHDPVLHHGDIQMDRNDENKMAYGGYANIKIHISTNNGVSFSIPSGTTHSDIRSIDFVNGKLIVGSDGEMVYSNDLGNTLTTKTNSISNHELWGFGSAFKSNLVASGNNHGPVMIKEDGNGFTWYNGTGADQGNTDVNPLDDRYIYSQGYSNYRYFRTGVHTLTNESNFLDLGGLYDYFNSIEFHPNKYYTIITHHAGQYPNGNPNLATWKNSLIKTEDNGNSISIVKTFSKQVFREKISAKNPNAMCVVEGITNNKLWKTTDEGATWTDITPNTTITLGPKNISDIAVGDNNANEIWVTYSGVQSDCKVLKSDDGGATWTNLSSSVLTTSPITKIIFQRGSNGGVYVGNKAGVFYKNNSMSNWVMLGDGLPMCDVRFMFINYNENKLKIGTSRGAFEHTLYEISPPSALISADKNKIYCPVTEKVQFKDYSVVRNASATWQWSFPGATPSTSSLENPTVSYKDAPNGLYSVTLTVTDQYGTSTQTLNNFIEVNNQCVQNFDPAKDYKIINRASGKSLDVYSGSLADGAKVIQWDYTGGNNQKWKLSQTGGSYKIINKNSNKLIDNPSSSTADGTIMTQYVDNGGANQQWQIVNLGTGYYKIINVSSGKALDNSGSSTTNGTDIVQWTYGGGNNQQWQIIEVFDPAKDYKIINRASGKSLDVYSASLADGAKLIQMDYTAGNNQKWKLAQTGGNYKIINKNSSKLVDNPSSSTTDGTIMTQYIDNGGVNQQWQLVDLGTGYYKIINASSGKALDNSGSSTTNGTNIVQWTYGGGNNQQWKIVDAASSTGKMAGSVMPLDQSNTIQKLIVYPNPLKSNTPVKIDVPAGWKNSTLFVFDSLGKLMVNATLKEGVNEMLLNVSTGVYYLKIVNQNDTFSTKLIVK
ncbi:RICIN domain-containing protein [Chryseobacterium sp. 'Rf worker isolate 10']|uniref:RICIN domain-containing protein n=1 Tax=Chryseobacterium sp. 'Rf worker isolate 10' TaxID=2887348 RepID=UPI003D701251